ncbi:Hypothetical predicted protein [Mytilus galloprovincialis]|uniref:C1q domain-containing protein n=1 Tax=Mytilus galloprovincialis TaxID=29158 RepID=A0A8B6GEG8_MYTGA|nr:Hypothetical predicted protein [Mytilus galloprovincialis]
MATRGFPFFLVFLSAHGFLLDKTQSTSGLSGTSNQYVTASELFGETKTRQLEDQQLRRYIDNAFAVLTSQLEHKFDALDQKFIRCENQSVPSQANGTLEQKYIDLERKHTDLDRKYMDLEKKYIQMQSMNNDKFYLLKKHFLTIQNKTSEISNDVNTLKQLGNSKPLQEIQTLQQQFTAVSAQVQSLTVIERVNRLDFLALYNTTIEQKIALSALNISGSSNQLVKLTEIQTNNSKQLLRLGELETKTSKELLRLEELESNTSKQLLRHVQNHNSSTAGIISKIEAMENQKNKTMSVMQKQINKNAERVAMTAHPSSSGTVSNIIKFNYVTFSVGITNLATYKSTGKFSCEQEGLYIISASVMSQTSSAYYCIYLNGNDISCTYIADHSGNDHHTAAVTVTRKLNLNDQVWLHTDGGWYLDGGDFSSFTIIK